MPGPALPGRESGRSDPAAPLPVDLASRVTNADVGKLLARIADGRPIAFDVQVDRDGNVDVRAPQWVKDKTRTNRPVRLNKIDEAKVTTCLATGGNLALAAALIGKGERTLKYILDAWPDLKEKIELSRRVANGIVRSSMWTNAVVKHNVAAQIFWAKNTLGWCDRSQVSATLNVNILPRLAEAAIDPVRRARVVEARQIERVELPAGSPTVADLIEGHEDRARHEPASD